MLYEFLNIHRDRYPHSISISTIANQMTLGKLQCLQFPQLPQLYKCENNSNTLCKIPVESSDEKCCMKLDTIGKLKKNAVIKLTRDALPLIEASQTF